MLKKLLPPALAAAGGVLGFCLRKWQLATGFEPDSGLAIPGAPAHLALLALTALVAAGLVLLCRSCPPGAAGLDARDNSPFLTACVLAAFLLLAGAILDTLDFPSARRAALAAAGGIPGLSVVLPGLRLALGFLGCPCALIWTRQLYRDPDQARESLPFLALWLLFCVWLISDYQTRAADPVVPDYFYAVFAILCSLMGLYYLGGYSFQQGKPRRTVVFCLLGAYFSLVTLADAHSLADLARYGFAILFLTAHAALILTSPQRGGAVTQEEPEEAPEREDDPHA